MAITSLAHRWAEAPRCSVLVECGRVGKSDSSVGSGSRADRAGRRRTRAFHNSRDLAQHVERWGYRRFWLAEHHGMPGIASAATSIVIAHVAAGTSRIRVGAGGIMLPNHSPLVVAEQFGTSSRSIRDDRPRARPRPGNRSADGARAPAPSERRRDRGVSAGCAGGDAILSAAGAAGADPERVGLPTGPADGFSRARGAGRRAARAGVDSRIEPVRRVPRSGARPAVRVRVALRAGADDGRDRVIPRGSSRRPNSSIARA